MSCYTTRDEQIILSVNYEDQRFLAGESNGQNFQDTIFVNANFTEALSNWIFAEYYLLNTGPDSLFNLPCIGPTTGPVVMQYYGIAD